jgi:hypothetical protein
MEELLIKQIENGIRAVRMGNKKPVDVTSDVNNKLERLKKLNEGMATDLNKKFISVVIDYNNRK